MSKSVGARAAGVVLLLIGLGAAWFFGLRPLWAAEAGAAHVSFQIKLFVFSPLAMVAGAVLALGGAPVLEAFSGPPVGKQQQAIVWTTMILALAAGGAAFLWFQLRLDALGYS
jgi:hypothetical protein